ncbi:MAG: hypothetical protein ACUVSL_04700 [Chloroflexus sp.]|uniref:hypothetical protein n=1 Tax=Chloroflexus sp. TaxID=1904827 RepID=UPI00404B8918
MLMKQMNKSLIKALVSYLLPSLLFVLGIIHVFPFKIDDVYIIMRYASNLASGHGLVFNPTGQRVEGFTSLLFVLIEAILIKAGVQDVLYIVKYLCITAGLTTIIVLVQYGQVVLRMYSKLWYLPAFCALLLATSSPYIIWTTSGMETTLFSFLVFMAIIMYLLFLRNMYKDIYLPVIDFLFVLAVITRPEGLLFYLTTLLHNILIGYFRDIELIRRRVKGIVFGVTLTLIYISWKISYFGSIIPLTYLAKQKEIDLTTFAGGIQRFIEFSKINGNYIILSVIMIYLVISVMFKDWNPILYYLPLVFIGYVIYLFSLGFRTSMDDAYRFYVPVIPLMSLLLLEIICSICRMAYVQSVLPTIAFCLLLMIPLRFSDLNYAWSTDFNWGIFPYRISGRIVSEGLDRAHIALGIWLKDNAPQNSKIVLYDAGAIPFVSNLYTIDTWSLNDPTLVKLYRDLKVSKSDEERQAVYSKVNQYILSFEPDYIIQDSTGLLEDPMVRQRYTPLGIKFVYIDSYFCENNEKKICSYVIEPWVLHR